ncbi:MAG: SDR family NAD(P)-dependent oxidoreductase [Deltaproteobacteria bacterium]|nr:SDR family NAD(P)-dependent oxidoreductase [Deltaproteobacteria bacterium]
MNDVQPRVAVVVGANLGLGAALLRQLAAAGWSTAAIGRAPALGELAREVATRCIVGDATDPHAMVEAVGTIEAELGPPALVIYNAHRVVLAPAMELTPEVFTSSWQATCLGAFVTAQAVLPGMLARGTGTLVFVGATASMRGGVRSAAFASAKFALRGLAQSLARELAPRGIHVAHVVLDGLIASARTHARFAAADDACMDPDAVARTFMMVIDQPRDTWTHELDLRRCDDRFF